MWQQIQTIIVDTNFCLSIYIFLKCSMRLMHLYGQITVSSHECIVNLIFQLLPKRGLLAPQIDHGP